MAQVTFAEEDIKQEPDESIDYLTKGQAITAGASLLAATCIYLGVRVAFIDYFVEDIGEISLQTEVISFHSELMNKRTNVLVMAAFLWLSMPLILVHIYYMEKVCDAIFHDMTFMKFAYIYGWFVQVMIISVLTAPTLIISCYYDWKFYEDGELVKIGYYIQLMLIHYALVLGDAVAIASCMSASIPWFMIFRAAQKKNDALYHNNLDYLLPMKCAKTGFCKIILIMLIVVVFWASMSSMFDLGGSGFYSLFGGSSLLIIVVYISYIFLSIWLFWIGAKADKLH